MATEPNHQKAFQDLEEDLVELRRSWMRKRLEGYDLAEVAQRIQGINQWIEAAKEGAEDERKRRGMGDYLSSI